MRHHILYVLATLWSACWSSEPPPLINAGNSCYSNAVIQNLYNLTDLRQQIIQSTQQQGVGNGIISALGKLFNAMHTYQNGKLERRALDNTVNEQFGNVCRATNFPSGQQQDAGELLTKTFDELSQVAPEAYKLLNFSTFSSKQCLGAHDIYFSINDDKTEHEDKALLLLSPENNFQSSHIKKVENEMFEGQNAIKCEDPQKMRREDKDIELVEKEGKTYFKKCKRTSSFSILPQKYLSIQINRFSPYFDQNTGSFVLKKNEKKFIVPKLTQLILPSGDRDNYKLIGSVNHLGSQLEGGHYIAYVLSDGTWYKCDDQTISSVKEDTALEKIRSNGYLLFFEKTQNTVPKQRAWYSPDPLQETIHDLASHLQALKRSV